MALRVSGIDSAAVQAIRGGGADANGQPALSEVARGLGNPCRHCLQPIAEGERKLVLAHRPFAQPQPYAEVGPIFLHEADCPHYEADRLPAWFAHMTPAIVRGYDARDWIRYETGRVARWVLRSARTQPLAGTARTRGP
jgi:hypothetical protein